MNESVLFITTKQASIETLNFYEDIERKNKFLFNCTCTKKIKFYAEFDFDINQSCWECAQ